MKIVRTIARLTIAALFLAAPFIVSVNAQPIEEGIPDAANGLTLAKKLCTNCHVISDDESDQGVAGVPAFKMLANREGTTEQQLAGAMIIPHPPMPDIHLERGEIRDLVAYIMSLRTN